MRYKMVNVFEREYRMTFEIIFVTGQRWVLLHGSQTRIVCIVISLPQVNLQSQKVVEYPACMPSKAGPILCDPMDYNQPGSSVHGILQARILGWVVMPSSRGIFLTQGSNLCLLGLLHWQMGFFFFFFYHQCHLGSPWNALINKK